MQGLQIFNFEQNEVRTLTIDDTPYFIGKDVAEVLGYSRPDNAIRNHVDEEDKLMHQISASGQKRNMFIINESGLYALIFGSQLESAKRFKRWVTSEVLPQIRKTGSFVKPMSSTELMRLQYEALEETNTRVDTVEKDVKYLKDEVKMDGGEYNYINRRVNIKVAEAVDIFALADEREIKNFLYKDINKGIHEITGVKTRSQVKQKHFNKLLEFIRRWEPSTATLMKVRQMSMDLDDEDVM